MKPYRKGEEFMDTALANVFSFRVCQYYVHDSFNQCCLWLIFSWAEKFTLCNGGSGSNSEPIVAYSPITLSDLLSLCSMCVLWQGGLWSTLSSAADERPWLYAVYVVVILLPIVLLSICLCPRSGPIKVGDHRTYIKTLHKLTDFASGFLHRNTRQGL